MFDKVKDKEQLLVLGLLIAVGIWFIYLINYSTGFAGGEDGVMHFLYAKYAGQYPLNLLNLWAKPVFTLLAFPFAQVGFKGVLIMNVFFGLATAYLTFLIARQLSFSPAWIAPLWLIFTPQYYFVMPSALTEILFSLFLTAAIWLVLGNRLFTACLFISFLPLVRSEGYLFILLFAIWLIYERKWKFIPALAIGLTVYSIVGGFHYHDLFWLMHQHPYGDASAIYGKGNWYHYLSSYRHIWGMPISFVLIPALVFTPFFCFKQGLKKKYSVGLFLVYGGFFGYLFAHSLVWALGKSGSLGLIRVMVATMPLAIIIAFGFWYFLLKRLRHKGISFFLQAAFLFLVIRTAPEMYPAPFHFEKEKPVLEKVGDWYKQSEYAGKQKVYLFAPSAYMALGLNPFDTKKTMGLHPGLATQQLEQGEIILWDSHFGPNEAGLPLEVLQKRNDLKVIAHFKPDPPFTTLNNYPYEVVLFQKVP